MNKTYTDFVESCEKPSTQAVYKHYIRIGQYDVNSHSKENLKSFFDSTTFISIRDFYSFAFVFRAYAKYLRNIDLLTDLDEIDVASIKEQLRNSAEKRFITYDEYLEFLHDIEMCEECNEIFFVTIVMCIYEGMFADSFDGLAMLRKQDVEDNCVTIHMRDGSHHKMEITPRLVANLRELADRNYWERYNAIGGILSLPATGEYSDSVFKFSFRNPKDIFTNTRNMIRTKFSKLTSRYELDITPTQLFYSGIIHRASLVCKEKYDLDFIEIFDKPEYTRIVHGLLRDEFARCGHNINYAMMRYNIAENIKDFRSKH